VTKDSNIGRLQEEKGSLYRFLSLWQTYYP
jgi:hypothetical protein